MENIELTAITLTLSNEELETISKAVEESGLSRAEYIRQQLAAPRPQASSAAATNPPSGQSDRALLEYLVYGLQAAHAALYKIAELGELVTPEQRNYVREGSAKLAREHLAHLGEKMAAVRQGIKASAAESAPELKIVTPEQKDNAVSRSV